MTLTELYNANYLPSYRLTKYLDNLRQQNADVQRTDGAYIDRILAIYKTETIDIDEYQDEGATHGR